MSAKQKILISNVVFIIIDIFFIVTGCLNFNLIFHGHITAILKYGGYSCMALFWTLYFFHDFIIFNLIIFFIIIILLLIRIKKQTSWNLK